MHEEDLPIVVETESGLLAGQQEDDVIGSPGVPFRKPPVGDLRFRPPEAPESWTGATIGPLLQHEGLVWGAFFSADEFRILTGSVDGTARLWRLDFSVGGDPTRSY